MRGIGLVTYQRRVHSFRKALGLSSREGKISHCSPGVPATHLFGDFLLFVPRECCERVVFCAYQNGDGSLQFKASSAGVVGVVSLTDLVESSSLPIPLLDAVQSRLPRQVKHEQNRNRVIRHQRQHGHELALT